MTDQKIQKTMLAVLAGERRDPPPIWLMRQAGRYLPEYRETRARAKNFIDFCFSPDLAVEVTLQPIRRFNFDASIIFADILLIPIALGRDVWFVTGEGPKLNPLSMSDVDQLTPDRTEEVLAPIAETVRGVKAGLPEETTLIGFAGAPWTVATYMIEGGGSKDRYAARTAAYGDPAAFQILLDALVESTARYLVMQAEAGAEVLKIFDSWAEGLPPPLFDRVVIQPTKAIVDKVRAAGVTLPIIGFPRGAGPLYKAYAEQTGVTALALDTALDPVWAHENLPAGMAVQGQLDPAALRVGGAALDAEIDRNLAVWAERPYIFNLGHGITPDVPIAHVERLIKRIRG
jgi:uroporphyrinogen decarboxylase